jgi:hypothetical protein
MAGLRDALDGNISVSFHGINNSVDWGDIKIKTSEQECCPKKTSCKF